MSLTVATKQMQQIADAPNGLIHDYDWSPKGNYIAFSMQSANGLSSVYIWSAADNKNLPRHAELSDANTPAFDTTGTLSLFPERSGICSADLECRIQLRDEPDER